MKYDGFFFQIMPFFAKFCLNTFTMYMFKTKNLAYQKMKCFKHVKFEPCFEHLNINW